MTYVPVPLAAAVQLMRADYMPLHQCRQHTERFFVRI